MQKPRLVIAGAILGVAVLVAAGLALGGAGSDDDGAGDRPTAASPSASAGRPAPDGDPGAVLAAAASGLDQQSYRVTVSSGTEDGTTLVWDPRVKRGLETTTLKVPTGKVTFERLLLGADTYVKVTAPDRRVPSWDGETWWHVATAGKPATGTQGLDNTRLGSTLSSPDAVRRTAEGAYSGTVDLTGSAAILGSGIAGILGARAGAVPFTATVDEQGRLVDYRIELGEQQGRPSRLEIVYSDFGLPVKVEKPAAETIGEDPPGNIPGV